MASVSSSQATLPRSRRKSSPAPVDPSGSAVHGQQPTRLWKLARLLVAGSKDQAFLDRVWVPWLFGTCPRRWRPRLALHLLSFSPHYWIYQWGNKYPASLSRSEVLWHEYQRNAASRQEICDKLLKPYLRGKITVLDFGCGPGFLARQTSAHVRKVIGADVSRGVIACARQLNPGSNVSYVRNGLSDLDAIPDAAVDLVYSFAVFQHLRKKQTLAFFREFARVLKPGGMAVCHTILRKPEDAREYDPNGWMKKRIMLRMVYYSEDEVRRLLAEAGFTDVQINNISDLTDIDDDIGSEQLATFRRSAAA